MRRLLPFIFLSFCFAACSKPDVAQQQFSSFDYRMDGSRFIPDVGVPSTVSQIIFSNIGEGIFKGFSVPAVPSPGHGKFSYMLSSGQNIITGDEKSSSIFASIPQSETITNILTDVYGSYIIHVNGCIEAFENSGKLRWQFKDDAFGVNPGNAILADSELIIAGEHNGIINYAKTGSNFFSAFNIHTGKEISGSTDGAPYQSIIFDPKSRRIIAASDSVINVHNMEGECTGYNVFQERFHASELRIISNICLCGKNKDKIAFGYLSKRSGTDERTMNVGVFTNIEHGQLQKVSSHEVPYLPINIASNGQMILVSGFYDSGNELTSGIDAFYADDTTKLWQRRFTYPLATPVAINEKYAYFTLTFSTQAEVPAQSIFYTLDLSTGKTVSELPVTGAQNGFAPGIPMPMEEGGFMLADRNKPIIYFLKP